MSVTSGILDAMTTRYYPAMPPIPLGALPTTRAWLALDSILGLVGEWPPLRERIAKQFSSERADEPRELFSVLHLAINTGRSQEMGRAIIGILSKDSTQMKRAEVVSWIRRCATMHKESGGQPHIVEVLINYLSRCDPAFGVLRAKPEFVDLWLGRMYGKNPKGLSPAPEYCAAVLSIEANAFGDKRSGKKRGLEGDYRYKRKDYVDAVAHAAKVQQVAQPPVVDVYGASDHFEMLLRAIKANWITRGEALLDDISDEGERLGVHPAPKWAELTIEDLRTALRQREAEAAKQRTQRTLPLVGERRRSGREKKVQKKTVK